MEGEICEYNQDEAEIQPEIYNNTKSEIIEIEEEDGDESNNNNVGSGSTSEEGSSNGYEVYVAVGKDDLQVLKWALDHALFPGARINLIHVFPPLSYVSTPVGRLRVNQLAPEQAKIYTREEENRRRNLLHKYIKLCNDNKVKVDTMLIESSETAKAILHLIPVLNITSLVMGTKHPNSSRRLIKGFGKGVLVQRHAPDYCRVVLVYMGKKPMNNQLRVPQTPSSFLASSEERRKTSQHVYRSSFNECRCFPVKFY